MTDKGNITDAEVAAARAAIVGNPFNDDDQIRRMLEAASRVHPAGEPVNVETAERILDYLGIGYEASREPGVDRRRDWLVKMLYASPVKEGE